MMKPISIKNTAKIEEAIAQAESRAKVRKISVNLISDVLEQVEKNVSSKKALIGTKVHYTGAEKFPNAYKYTPESTHFYAEYTASGWKILDIYRDTCPNKFNDVNVEYSETAIQKILEAAQSFKA